MDVTALLLVGLLMVVGLIGVVLPVVPGLLLIAVSGVVWAVLEDGKGSWAVAGLMLAVLALGTIAKYALPGRTLRQARTPRSTLLLGIVGAVVGFFVVPVMGLVVGGVLGLWIGERQRLDTADAAWRSTQATVKAIGAGMLVELAAGVVAVLIWLIGVWILHA
jgi:uncharacterized protein YqgC (DUF456 family)